MVIQYGESSIINLKLNVSIQPQQSTKLFRYLRKLYIDMGIHKSITIQCACMYISLM
jgi:hypothetical protein